MAVDGSTNGTYLCRFMIASLKTRCLTVSSDTSENDNWRFHDSQMECSKQCPSGGEGITSMSWTVRPGLELSPWPFHSQVNWPSCSAPLLSILGCWCTSNPMALQHKSMWPGSVHSHREGADAELNVPLAHSYQFSSVESWTGRMNCSGETWSMCQVNPSGTKVWQMW